MTNKQHQGHFSTVTIHDKKLADRYNDDIQLITPAANLNLRHLLTIALIAAAATSVYAADQAKEQNGLGPALLWQDPSGVVVAQTITPIGREFYDGFVAAWREKDGDSRFSIAIAEHPSARWGSQIFVNYGNRRLFQAFLPANRVRVREVAGMAADIVFQRIIESQVAQLFGDADLAKDEF